MVAPLFAETFFGIRLLSTRISLLTTLCGTDSLCRGPEREMRGFALRTHPTLSSDPPEERIATLNSVLWCYPTPPPVLRGDRRLSSIHISFVLDDGGCVNVVMCIFLMCLFCTGIG